MNSIILKTASFILCAAFVLNFSVFAESENEMKKKILSGVDLAGESAEELMAGDDEKAVVSSKNTPKRLPSTFERDVPYSAAVKNFMNAHYNHGISSFAQRKQYYNNAIAEAEKIPDEYARLVNLSRAEYFYGSSIIETFDLTTLESMDLTKDSGESVNAQAGAVFDKAIEYAEAALAIKKGSDAYTSLSQAISANCTTKTTSYVLNNGLKVRANAKKAVAADYSNGTAHFLIIAQDIYAPWPFSKLNSGKKKMQEALNDKYIRIEDQERLLICSAIGYGFFKQKKWDKAIEWYNAALKVYPNNYSAHQMIGKVNAARSKKK